MRGTILCVLVVVSFYDQILHASELLMAGTPSAWSGLSHLYRVCSACREQEENELLLERLNHQRNPQVVLEIPQERFVISRETEQQAVSREWYVSDEVSACFNIKEVCKEHMPCTVAYVFSSILVAGAVGLIYCWNTNIVLQ